MADHTPAADISTTSAWQALSAHHVAVEATTLRELFADDPDRGRELTLTVGDLYIDYSKHRVTRETLALLLDLARAAGLEERRDAMFAGQHINTSEDRAVLHTALRLPRGDRVAMLFAGAQNVQQALDKLCAIGAEDIAYLLPNCAASEGRSLKDRLRAVLGAVGGGDRVFAVVAALDEERKSIAEPLRQRRGPGAEGDDGLFASDAAGQ